MLKKKNAVLYIFLFIKEYWEKHNGFQNILSSKTVFNIGNK